MWRNPSGLCCINKAHLQFCTVLCKVYIKKNTAGVVVVGNWTKDHRTLTKDYKIRQRRWLREAQLYPCRPRSLPSSLSSTANFISFPDWKTPCSVHFIPTKSLPLFSATVLCNSLLQGAFAACGSCCSSLPAGSPTLLCGSISRPSTGNLKDGAIPPLHSTSPDPEDHMS